MPRLTRATLGEAVDLLEIWVLKLVLRALRGPLSRTVGRLGAAWRVAFTDPIRCSRAILDALVSRANRGVKSCFGGLSGVAGVEGGNSIFADAVLWRLESPSLLRICTDLGAPRAIGCLTNFDSVVADVGKSSKTSSSLPSPKALRRMGFVTVRLEAASRVRDSGATSRRPVGVLGR